MTAARIILDLDGTLLDTRRRHHALYASGVREQGGAPLPIAAFWRAKRQGVSWPRLLERTLGRPADVDRFFAGWKRDVESDRMLVLDELHPDAVRGLRSLVAAGWAATLVTARRDPAALSRQLARLGIDQSFEAAIATEGAPKHLAIEGRGRFDHWIGDTEDDIASARAAGIPVTAVTSGIRGPSLLARAEPDALARSFGAAVKRLV